VAHQQRRRSSLEVRTEAVDASAESFEHVKVPLAHQRDGVPRLPGVARLDQTEERRQAVAEIRMT
jgi:hypothetical protein